MKQLEQCKWFEICINYYLFLKFRISSLKTLFFAPRFALLFIISHVLPFVLPTLLAFSHRKVIVKRIWAAKWSEVASQEKERKLRSRSGLLKGAKKKVTFLKWCDKAFRLSCYTIPISQAIFKSKLCVPSYITEYPSDPSVVIAALTLNSFPFRSHRHNIKDNVVAEAIQKPATPPYLLCL